jgi:hypothetical protein
MSTFLTGVSAILREGMQVKRNVTMTRATVGITAAGDEVRGM